jgi:pilus assembly protein CpaC
MNNNNRIRIGRNRLLCAVATTGVMATLAMPAHAQPVAETAALTSAAPRKGSAKVAMQTAALKTADTPAKSAAAPRAMNVPVCTGEFAPTANVNLPEGKSGLLDLQQLHLPSPAWLRTIGDPELVQVEPTVSRDPRAMFFVFGKKVGSTNLMFQNREGRCAMVEVSVGVDTAAVQSKLSQLMPEEKNIKIGAAADSLVLSGSVSDAIAADKAVSIANAYVRKAGGGAAGDKGNERVVNMLSVAAPQQVMLEVKVAEVSKTLLDQLGADFSAARHRGNWAASLVSNFLSSSAGVFNLTKTSTGEFVTLDAQNKDGLVKILAEPTIMAISGQEGSFLAGGKIFIPVSQTTGTSGVPTITLEEKEFGVGLRFTPTVLDGGRINLKVAPEVSELSREGVGISSTATGGNAVLPLITTRRAATTVQLFDGQSFAIAGLIKNNVTQNIKALPVLGEVPVLGALFRSSDFQTDRTELVFIITPRLVKPLPPDYAMPTDQFIEPSRAEFFLGGRMEGSPPKPATAGDGGAVAPTSATTSSTKPAAQNAGPSGFELK